MSQPNFNQDKNAGRINPFLDKVLWVGLGDRPWGPSIRAKRRFDPNAAKGGGSFTEWPDKQGITLDWKPVSWNLSPIKPDGGGGHFGMLVIIAEIGPQWYAWNIEYLRKSTEERGTSSVNTEGWDGPEDWIDLVFNYKTFSPVKGTGYRPDPGDWVGFMIVPHPDATPKVQDVRTDILPVQINPNEAPPEPDPDPDPGPGPGPGPDPEPDPALDYDVIAAEVAKRLRIVGA